MVPWRRSGTGMVLGKFLPPTQGHRYLVDFARGFVEDLTVVVGTLEREPIPGALRVAWMREMFPDVRVVHLTDENPQVPEEHPDFWGIWRRSLLRVLPAAPDWVFASEEYGSRLAAELGARFVPVDLARELVPARASAVREDPLACWEHLPECVRPSYVVRVAIIGPESTGKSTLARDLARRFGTVHVHEWARPLIDQRGGVVDREVFPLILRGQAAAEEAMARRANRILFCDSEAFTTALYHELYIGGCPAEILEEAERRRYDLYLVTEPDTPYVADVQRAFPERRGWFLGRCIEWVERRGAPYARIRGGWDERLRTAVEAVEALLAARTGRAPR